MDNKIKRITASIIDFIIAILIGNLPMTLLNVLGNSEKLVEILLTFICLTIFLILFIKKDCIIGTESLGKKIMNLKIYLNGNIVTDKKILSNRVLASMFYFPLYPIDILFEGKSKGDAVYHTEVK